MKVAVIGKGMVGTAIAKGLTNKGHEVKFGHRDPKESVFEAAKWGEIVFIAVPYEAIADTVKELGTAADGKPVVDVTNEIGSKGELAVGFSTSGAEELQKKLPKAFVVKAFNTVFAVNQSSGKVGNEQLTLFVASDNSKAKETVIRLGRDIGFDSVDAGPLKSARYLEPMAMLIIDLAFRFRMGTNIGYKLVKG
ncbi:MAG TPA: NADPH-dependent F420 reductase [Candidatus Acidoferrales bacterium]|nr:NADPH-dependent F420 reductase [Candidatus Acidoferrales bacterium]